MGLWKKATGRSGMVFRTRSKTRGMARKMKGSQPSDGDSDSAGVSHT